MSDSSNSIGNTAVICFSNNYGGMEYDAARLVQNINRYIGRCQLVIRKSSWLEEYAREHEISHVTINFRGSLSIRAAMAMREAWRTNDIHNIIFFGSSEMPSIFFSISPQIRAFIVRHGTTKSSSKKDLLHKITWSRVSAHWCISRHIEENVKRIFPIGKAATFVSYVSLGEKVEDIPESSHLSPADESFRIAHVGRLVKGKGQCEAISVVKALHHLNIPADLTLYGQGEDEAYLRSIVEDMRLLDNVHFAGHVEAPYREFDSYHAFLFPSHGEGLGNAFIEALATGMHCFCYENTVFPELKDLGLTFNMIPDGDIDGLVSAMASVWESRMAPPIGNKNLCREIFSITKEMNDLRQHIR